MRKTLHLLKGAPAVAAATLERQVREPGTTVTIVLLHDTPAPPVPPGVAVRRVGRDLDYGELLELIFESDQVIAW